MTSLKSSCHPLRAAGWVIVFILFVVNAASATYPGQNGRIVFVAHFTDSWQLYTINPLNGLLTFVEGQRTQGADPDAVALTPQGDYAIVANTSEKHLMTFKIDPFSGRMTPVGLTTEAVQKNQLRFRIAAFFGIKSRS